MYGKAYFFYFFKYIFNELHERKVKPLDKRKEKARRGNSKKKAATGEKVAVKQDA
jgi:hypothetical protein